MLKRTLGHTALQVSTIGFGASALGDVFGAVDPMSGCAGVLHAIDCGINFFDVSPYYGITLAETRLGEALSGRRGEVVLATKCGRYGVDHFDFSATTVRREFEQSLRRLKTEYVDLLQVHDVEFGSVDQIVNETLPALYQLQQDGKARYIGITGYWPGLLARIASQTHVDSVLNYCHGNLMANDMDRLLAPLAVELGFGLLNASPLHMGLIGDGDVPVWHPAPADVKQAARTVVALCREYGVNPATVAIYECLQRPAVASTFIGLRSSREVDDALGALEFVPPADLMERIRETLRPVFNTTWPSGLLQNQPEVVTNAY